MISRRGLLVTGGATAVVGGLGAVVYAHGPGLGEARLPWSQAGSGFDDPRLNALSYAILAPNPHNRQPWMFELVGGDQIDVYCDLDRRLPHTDPFDRQITIGFGCMLELMRISAAETGYAVDLVPFPDGEAYPVLSEQRIAKVTIRRDNNVARDPLFSNILDRRSTKEPFDPSKPVELAVLNRVIDSGRGDLAISGTLEPEKVSRITDACWLGFMIEMETARTRRESVDLMRIGNRAVVNNPDGIDMGGLPMGLMKMAGIVTPKGLDTPGTTAYKTGIEMYRDIIHTAMGFAWIKADANTRISQLQAGKSWVRMNLAAQQAGLCIHPMSQVLQEYPEMVEPYATTQAELGAENGGVIHMLGRVGYTAFPSPSPRWPLQSKLIERSV